jgi:hypothetical protein
MYTSVRRSPDYPGYERRLGIARYTMARNFAREARKRGLLKKKPFSFAPKRKSKTLCFGFIRWWHAFLLCKRIFKPFV